jgi:hypothetical protein
MMQTPGIKVNPVYQSPAMTSTGGVPDAFMPDDHVPARSTARGSRR